MECVWCQFFIPNLVASEVSRVNIVLSDAIVNLCSKDVKQDDNVILDATEYLFVSTNLAKNYSNTMESMLILSYHTYLPGEIAKKWQHGVSARIHRHNQVHQSLLMVTMFLLLQSMATMPFIFHQMFIRFTQPFFLFGLVYIGSLIIANVLYTSLVATALLLFIAYLTYIYFYKKNHHVALSVSPAVENNSNNNTDEKINSDLIEHEDIIIHDYDDMINKELNTKEYNNNNSSKCLSDNSSTNYPSLYDELQEKGNYEYDDGASDLYTVHRESTIDDSKCQSNSLYGSLTHPSVLYCDSQEKTNDQYDISDSDSSSNSLPSNDTSDT